MSSPIFDNLVNEIEETMKNEARFGQCLYCRGYGIRNNGGDVIDCTYCEGSGIDYARDSKGRFKTLWWDSEYNFERQFIRDLRNIGLYARGGRVPGYAAKDIRPYERTFTPNEIREFGRMSPIGFL